MKFPKNQLALMIAALSTTPYAQAVNVSGTSVTVTDDQSNTPYQVSNNGELIVDGGSVGSLSVNNSTLTIHNGGTYAGSDMQEAIYSSKSDINLDGVTATTSNAQQSILSVASNLHIADSTLTQNGGSAVIGINNADATGSPQTLISNSTLNLVNSTGNGGAVNLESASTSTISDSVINSVLSGVNYINSSGSLLNTTVNAEGYGVQSQAIAFNYRPVNVIARNAIITGRQGGALLSDGTLNLQSTSVSGTGEDANGITAGSRGITDSPSTLELITSQVKGNNNGILMTPTTPDGNGHQVNLSINNSAVTGETGAAISVENMTADISVLNGSTLSGGDNVLLNNASNGNASLRVENATLFGDVVTDNSSTTTVSLRKNAQLTGLLTGAASLNVGDHSTWNMTGNDNPGALTINNGTVNFGSSGTGFKTLTVSSLSGTGRFLMNTNLAANTGDLLNVTGEATGTYVLAIANTGNEPQAGGEDLQVVHTGSGNAAFSVEGGKVDAGAWQYSLSKQGTDWYLTQDSDDSLPPDPAPVPPNGDRTTSPSTDAILSLASAPVTIFNAEMQSLRFRHGDIQTNTLAPGGVWGRILGSNNRISGPYGSAYKIGQTGMETGADTVIDVNSGRVALGAFVSYTSNKISHARGGQSTVNSTGGGLYATWMADSGLYVDAVAKYNHFSNDINARMTDNTPAKGSYSQDAFGGSLETGMTFTTASPVWLQPYIRATAMQAGGEDVKLDNGMKANIDTTNSFQGEAGVNVGLDVSIAGATVKPYVSLAVSHEFVDNNRVAINDTWNFDNDISGTTGKYGAGLSAQITKNAGVWLEGQYQNGKHIESPIAANAGFRITF
ncbi:autotransporter outer membrane beta-barrel domain-containing protein [Jejubacter calystegiae]|nr:autotransporter outer membrane beta-barrel domain-containing protein [Jejubacter calystegiae]